MFEWLDRRRIQWLMTCYGKQSIEAVRSLVIDFIKMFEATDSFIDWYPDDDLYGMYQRGIMAAPDEVRKTLARNSHVLLRIENLSDPKTRWLTEFAPYPNCVDVWNRRIRKLNLSVSDAHSIQISFRYPQAPAVRQLTELSSLNFDQLPGSDRRMC